MTSKLVVNEIAADTGISTITVGDNMSGVTFKTGTSNLHNVGIEIAGINVLGADTPIGAGATIYNSGDVLVGGAITATAFSGSGASLTNIPDSALSAVTASKLSGALPAISGASLTNLPAQATIANNADNRVITGGSGVNLNGESTLLWSGNALSAYRDNATAYGPGIVAHHQRGTIASPSVSQTNDTLLNIVAKGYDGDEYHDAARIDFVSGGGTPGNNDMPGSILFKTTDDGQATSTTRLTIQQNGNLLLDNSSTLLIPEAIQHVGDTDTQIHFGTDAIKFDTAGVQRLRIYDDGVVAIGQSTKSSTVGAGGLDIQGNATNCIIEMGNPFPGFSGGVTPEFRITATNSGHEVKFESIWGGDNALHPHIGLTGGRTHFYKGTNSDEIARFDADKFFIGQTTGSSRLCVSDTNPVIAELHHSDGGTNDEARLILGALANNPPSNRGAGIAAVNNGAGHDLTVKCSASHSAGPGERVRFKSNGDVSILDGNLILGSGHGIDFSATGNNSGMTSELFDHYEEGSWTPSFYPMSSALTHSYNLRTGSYVRIGRVVYWQFRMRLASMSGNRNQALALSGLPYTVDSGQPQCSANIFGESWDGEIPSTVFYSGNTTRAEFYYYTSSQKYYQSSCLDLNVSNSYTVGSGFYFAA